MNYDYWKQQQSDTPLFPEIEWGKPEQRAMRGRLGIIGGNKLGFAGVANAYSTALTAGAGEVRALIPDALRATIPKTITDTRFSASNPSGSFAADALPDMHALGAWANGILLIGDAGRNSETAVLYERFINEYQGQLTLTRDAVDLIKHNANSIIDRPNTLLVVSFAQLQKLFQAMYYPKILTFSMQLGMFVEALHKFTITYPCTIAVLHSDHLVVAYNGEVITTTWRNPMAIWRGSVAGRAATYLLWTPEKPLQATATSLVTTN